jgi:hypothetical protein
MKDRDVIQFIVLGSIILTILTYFVLQYGWVWVFTELISAF